MNRGITMGAAVLLAGAGAIVLFRESSGSEETGAGSGDGSVSRASGMNKSLEGRSRRATPTDAERSLRSFLGTRNRNAPKFEKLETLARLASAEDLWQLIRDSRDGEGGSFNNPALTVNGWLRAAAFAELGRREPEPTLAALFGPNSPVGDNLYDGSEQYPLLFPALFSVFRGWGEVDPAAAAARLAKTTFVPQPGKGISEIEEWKTEVYGEIFGSWAASDVEEALAHLPERGMTSYRIRALEGLITGVNDVQRVSEFQALAQNEFAETSAVSSGPLHLQDSNVDYLDLMGMMLMNRVRMLVADRERVTPELEEIVTIANRGDLENGSINLVDFGQLLRFGARSPDDAISLLGPGSDVHARLAQGVLSEHPERAVEVLQALKPSQHAQVLRDSIRQAASFGSTHWYPGPGRHARLPVPELTEQHFEAAIEAADLTAGQRNRLLDLLLGTPDPAPVPEPEPEPNFGESR